MSYDLSEPQNVYRKLAEAYMETVSLLAKSRHAPWNRDVTKQLAWDYLLEVTLFEDQRATILELEHVLSGSRSTIRRKLLQMVEAGDLEMEGEEVRMTFRCAQKGLDRMAFFARNNHLHMLRYAQKVMEIRGENLEECIADTERIVAEDAGVQNGQG